MRSDKRILIVLLILTLCLQGCSYVGADNTEKIVAPENNLISIAGTWQIEKYKTFSEEGGNTNDTPVWVGRKAEFNTQYARLGDEICMNPQYKFKNMNAKRYFLYTYQVDFRNLDLENKDVQIVSISSEDGHFYDFVVIDNEHIIVNIEGIFYYLNRISTEFTHTDIPLFKIKTDYNKLPQMKNTGLIRSGILLGLRSAGDNGSTYRTLWVTSHDRKLSPVLEGSNLLVPRKSGFWVLGVKRTFNNNYFKDTLFTYPLENNLKRKHVPEKEKDFKKTSARNILFVGNDYIATEYGEASNGETLYFDQLQVLPIDNLEKNKQIKISDVAGKSGKNVFITAGKVRMLAERKNIQLENRPREESFTMARKNGHWIMKGRLNSNQKNRFVDFTINLIPPEKILNFDELYVSWNKIKEKVPQALDAFTSPNRDLAIIVCKDAVYVYILKGEKLSNQPVEKININEGESVIMAEWATGDYVDRWQKEFENWVEMK